MSGLRRKGGRSGRGICGAEHSSLSCTLGSEASTASLLFNLVLSAHCFAYFRCFRLVCNDFRAVQVLNKGHHSREGDREAIGVRDREAGWKAAIGRRGGRAAIGRRVARAPIGRQQRRHF